MKSVQALIIKVTDSAKDNGISQRELAKRVGITPENLSRAKKKGEISASTLQAMAEVLDMELTLTARETMKGERSCAARHSV